MKDTLEEQTFSELYKEYEQPFTRFAKAFVCEAVVAEDIVADSFVYYWENRLSLKNELNIPAYVLTVVKHKCINYLQSKKIHKEIIKKIAKDENEELDLQIATPDVRDSKKLFSDEIRQIIRRTLSALPHESQEIFLRSKYRKEHHKDIARTMGLSEKSIEYHITKTLKRLRTALKDYLIA